MNTFIPSRRKMAYANLYRRITKKFTSAIKLTLFTVRIYLQYFLLMFPPGQNFITGGILKI